MKFFGAVFADKLDIFVVFKELYVATANAIATICVRLGAGLISIFLDAS